MKGPKDDLKWFGEGFDGFPRHLPEDCVEYTLYIIDPKLQSDVDVLPRLKEVQQAAQDLTKELLDGYIWQRECFAVELQDQSGAKVLYGRTSCGDSIEDEWLIVYLLKKLSSRFKELWVRLQDTDGEFLLIEAADALPRWLNPEVAENRVWLHDGKLLVIPLSKDKNDSDQGRKTVPRPLTTTDARQFILHSQSDMIHSSRMEEEAFRRLRNYPKQISKNLHRAIITIPRIIALMLHEHPEYISPITEAFYLRDPISMQWLDTKKPGQKLADEKLLSLPEDLVDVQIKFTRVGYAQLKSQEFAAPLGWATVLKTKGVDQLALARAEMGMKVSCGLDMLYKDIQNQHKPLIEEIRRIHKGVRAGSLRLPSDVDLQGWDDTEDDDSWLDINFVDFERTLAGGQEGKSSKHGEPQPKARTGFGDRGAEEQLRTIVDRFEKFMADDSAGLDGAEYLDDMDYDDDEDDDESLENGEAKEKSFGENEFASMMREMMGLPPEEDSVPNAAPLATRKDASFVEELDSDDNDLDAEEIRKLMRQMEIELNEVGALDLDPTSNKISATKARKRNASDAEEVDVNVNLAKNLLESFKGQGGVAGPGGNLIGLMGLQLPRDEDETPSPDSSARKP